MRKNLPVTDVDYPLQDGLAIVSKTDLKGKITYVNPYFIEVSGFAEDELLGQPHNIVRHPDMPPEAYADLWSTLKSGLPWTGMVKNRRKNGDYYWVVANVTPVHEGGRVTGYMSVRTKPDRAQVREAEDLYRRMREKHATGLALRHGMLVRTGIRGWIGKVEGMPFSVMLALQTGSSCALMAAIVAIASLQPASAGGWIIGLSVAAIGLGLLGWYTLHKSIVSPVADAILTARAVAGGNLASSFDVRHRGDIGRLTRALQQMNVNLQAIIGDVRANIQSIMAGTRELEAGNSGLAGRTESQAASLEETASSMVQLSTTVRQNADNAAQANQLGLSASTVAAKGGEVVRQVVDTMQGISASSRKVGDIVGLIEGIAFQTNMLALNAAVEAARAGEQGRGFAVVAGEVRSLAQRCSVAAKEIKELTDAAVCQVDDGTTLVQQAGATMDEIMESVNRVTGIMGEISAASMEQNAGIEQVNQAISHMDGATQQNAALVEQAAASASALASQAERLVQAVSVFSLKR